MQGRGGGTGCLERRGVWQSNHFRTVSSGWTSSFLWQRDQAEEGEGCKGNNHTTVFLKGPNLCPEVSRQFWKPVRIQEWGQVRLVFTVFGRKKKSNLHYHLWDANTFLMLKRLCFNYLLQNKFLMISNLLNLFFLLINLSFGVQELFFLTPDLKTFLLYLFP